MHFDMVQVENDTHSNIGGVFYHFMNIKEGVLNGDKTIQVLDKGFVTRKAYKQNAIYTTMECYKTGVMGSCCDKKVKHSGSRIYHITI